MGQDDIFSLSSGRMEIQRIVLLELRIASQGWDINGSIFFGAHVYYFVVCEVTAKESIWNDDVSFVTPHVKR